MKKSEAVDDILEEEFSSKEVIENDFVKEAVSKPKLQKMFRAKVFFSLIKSSHKDGLLKMDFCNGGYRRNNIFLVSHSFRRSCIFPRFSVSIFPSSLLQSL